MSENTHTALTPDRTTLIESNGQVCLSLEFNNKQEDILINLNSSSIDYLNAELNTLHKKSLIAAEFMK